MAKGGINIKGIEGLERKLRQLPELVERAAKQAIREETHEDAQDLRRLAPVLSGDLRKSIQEEYTHKGLVGRAVVTDKAGQEIVHGTSDTPAHDFVTPVINTTRRRFPGRFERIVRDELRKL